MQLHELIQEALTLKQAKPYVKAWDPNFHKAVFERQPHKDKHAYRVYLPFETESKKQVNIPEALLAYLQTAIPQKPYMTDADAYMQGLAYEVANPTRKLGIGKMLARSEAQEKDPTRKSQLQALKKAFDADPQRAATRKADKLIVISRHPYDVAGMSTDRGWRSCMNLVDGINRHYVLRDVKQGSIIAYLINSDDLNIRNPLARILIKPYQQKGNPSNLAMMGDAVYGTAPPEFKQQVDAWINARYNADKSGLYCLAKGLYRDLIPASMRLLNDEDFAKLPVKDVVKLGGNDDATWTRIARVRSDADEIFTQIAEKHDTKAAKLIKQIDIDRLTAAIKRSPQILARLHTQPPELISAALQLDANNVRFVRNRTPEQHAQVLKLLKQNPERIRSVHAPTIEQIRYAVSKYTWLFSWAMEKHPDAISEGEVRSYILRILKEEGSMDWRELTKINAAFPSIMEDDKILHALTKEMSGWIVENIKLTPRLVQKMVLNANYSPEYYEERWFQDHEAKLINLLKQLPESERDVKLLPTVMRKYPELLSAFPDINPEALRKIVKEYPRAISYWPDPSLDLVYIALKHDLDDDLEGHFQEDKYIPVWLKLIQQDPINIDKLDDPAEVILKAAAIHPELDWRYARKILLALRVTPAVQVRVLKRYPVLIHVISKPSLAAQMAAVHADPDVYDRIKPKDRHPAVKAYMAAYRKEMRKPE
jgi:hypothetical protein